MLKRILTILIALTLLTSVFPIGASAASSEEEQRIRDQITTVYWQTLSSSGRSSLHGFCGVMAGWELYHLGVTERAVTHNGNEMYDMLRVSDQIREGYMVQCYPASEYNILEALNAITQNGTRDAYNIMVGFQRTRTAAGSRYGHVTVIHAVLNGNVYFTEGFTTPFNPEPSQAMVCTIAEFAEYYNSWATFEGMIYFGDGSQVAGCDTYGCSLFVASESVVTLWTRPDFSAAEEVRTVAAGERLYVNALCQNAEGVMFYRVVENGAEYFAAADQLKPVWFDAEELTAHDVVLPQQLDKGENFPISGVIRSGRSTIVGAALEVTDQNGQVILSCEIQKESGMLDLNSDFAEQSMDLNVLSDGQYTYSVYCDLKSTYWENGELADHVQRKLAVKSEVLIGNAIPAGMSKRVTVQTSQPENVLEGWQYENGSWYYYEEGVARTGWFCDAGIDYYFLEDGTAATGWQVINGKDRYFSETGAMRTGWLHTAEGSYFMLSNGAPAIGMMTIEGSQYVFGVQGKMLTDTTVEVNGVLYSADSSGLIVPNP